MSKILIANWKMHLTQQEALKLLRSYHINKAETELIIAAPSIYLSSMSSYLTSNIALAAQNISHLSANFGPYTGEISALMLKELGVKYSIIGHSERRSHLGEENLQLRAKIDFCIEYGMVPIICVGGKKEFPVQETLQYLLDDLEQLLPQAITMPLIIAYEPVWAIGTGKTPSIAELDIIFMSLQHYLGKKYTNIAKNVSLVYGGSVNISSIADIIAVLAIDGLLVGGASLRADEFNKIISYIESL